MPEKKDYWIVYHTAGQGQDHLAWAPAFRAFGHGLPRAEVHFIKGVLALRRSSTLPNDRRPQILKSAPWDAAS